MDSSPRALPFVLTGALALLLLGGIALSLWSAPPFVEQQLHDAARATMSASSFALKDTNSVSLLHSTAQSPGNGQTVGSVVFLVLYQAPASVQETEVEPNGATASVILIGDRRFRKSGSSWIELPPSAGLGARAVATITAPLQGAIDATHVTRQGDRYSFLPRDLDTLLTTALGVDPSRLSSPHLTAVVRGGTLTRETITAMVTNQRLQVDLVFSAIGSAPPVIAPRSASVATPPVSGPTPH
ncbi:MAG TPA: hypothetical protein VMU64_02840 [Acidimicrobiales bacterium]|nr:hypothetical protein [Acidimicrobiales bacterium]